mmetsp:Transcript_7406/g.15347  ORF Transcript_7406/g.15347 Transcript_7406/m.15347 type:complete len:138 (-) Transcript_7406:689-1102(-)
MTREPRRLPIARIAIRWRPAPSRLPLLMLILTVLLVGAAHVRSGLAPLPVVVPPPYRRHIRPPAFFVPTLPRYLRDGPIRGRSPTAVPSEGDGDATCPAHVAIIMDGNSRASNNVAYRRGARRTLSLYLGSSCRRPK